MILIWIALNPAQISKGKKEKKEKKLLKTILAYSKPKKYSST